MRKILISLAISGFAINAQASPDSFQEKMDAFGKQWISDKLSIHANTDQYSWSGSNGTSGSQNVTPITASYRMDNFEMGLRTAYIISENTTVNRRGYVSTLSDTALSFAYTQNLMPSWDLRFNVDWNAPTGQATLSGAEKNAIMDGNLVQQTRFGEGHNVTPGFVLTKSFGNNASLGVGLSHTIRGSFDPSGDVANDLYSPGDETRASLQGQYSEQNWQVVGGLIYTNSQTTRVNHQKYFRKGDRFDVNLSASYTLPYDQRLSGSFRYGVQTRDTYVNSISGNFEQESHNSNGDNVYLSLEYAKTFYEKHTIRLVGDWMMNDRNSYDQLNNLYYAGREKWQIGLGYDYRIDNKKKLFFMARNIEVQDNATPLTKVGTHYSGWNLSAGLDWAF